MAKKSPKQEQLRYTKEEALEEASKLREKVEEGEAKNYEEAEKLVEEEKGERKFKKRFLLVYRENELFKNYIPIIANILEKEGCQIEAKSFPAGTPEEEIKKWYSSNKERVESSYVLSDNTSRRSTGLKGQIPRYRTNCENLDNFLLRLTEEKIPTAIGFHKSAENIADLAKELKKDSENLEIKERYLSELGKLYKKILSLLPEEEKEKEFFIIKGIRDYPSLIEHEPFGPFYYHHIFKSLREFGTPKALPEKVQSDEDWEKIKREAEELASRMEQWFREAGCPRVSAYSSVAEFPPESVEKIKNNQAYIIYDRHVRYDVDTYRSKPGHVAKIKEFWGDYLSDAKLIDEKALQVPISNFFDSVVKKIKSKLNIDKEKLEEATKRIATDFLRKDLEEIKKLEEGEMQKNSE